MSLQKHRNILHIMTIVTICKAGSDRTLHCLAGDCIYDSMTVTTPGSPAPPIICGYNTGQHMYVESSDQCNKIVFNLGLKSSSISARTWMIRVSQFDSTQDSSFVPPIGSELPGGVRDL